MEPGRWEPRSATCAALGGSPDGTTKREGVALGTFLETDPQSSGFSLFRELFAKTGILFSDWITVVAFSSWPGLVVSVQIRNCC